MRMAMIGRCRCFEWIAVIRRGCGSALDGIMSVMVDMQMLPGLALWQVVDRVAYLRHGREGTVEREDQRQKDSEEQPHCDRF